MVDVRLAKCTDSEMWNKIVLMSNEGEVFHIFEWTDVLQQLGLRPFYLVAEDQGEIVGILPMVYNPFFFCKTLMSPPFRNLEYGGPCAVSGPKHNEVIQTFFEYIDRTAKELGVDLVEFTHASRNYSKLAEIHGFAEETIGYTFIYPLDRPFNVTWNERFSKNFRYAVRKALRERVSIREAKTMEDLLNYYEIYLDTMRRLRGVPFSFSFFKSLWNVLKPKKLLNLFLAEHEGRIIAGQIVLLYKRKIQIFNNASLRKYWRLKPNNLIDYWTIKYGYEQGFNVVDFGGTPPPPSGHYEYKKSIGGKPVPIFSYRKLFSPTKVKLWELTYRFLLKHFHYLLKT